MACLNGIDTLFMLTEEREVGSIGRLGVRIQTIGAPVEHRGKRVPSMISTRGVLKNLNFLIRPLYRTIAAEVANGL